VADGCRKTVRWRRGGLANVTRNEWIRGGVMAWSRLSRDGVERQLRFVTAGRATLRAGPCDRRRLTTSGFGVAASESLSRAPSRRNRPGLASGRSALNSFRGTGKTPLGIPVGSRRGSTERGATEQTWRRDAVSAGSKLTKRRPREQRHVFFHGRGSCRVPMQEKRRRAVTGEDVETPDGRHPARGQRSRSSRRLPPAWGSPTSKPSARDHGGQTRRG